MSVDFGNVLIAMQADEIPRARKGKWFIQSRVSTTAQLAEKTGAPIGFHYTVLGRDISYGDQECVMSDNPRELRRHFEGIYHARGRVLVTGLGLGCVVRGLLCNTRVTHVDVVERDPAVIDLVWPYMPDDPRIEIHQSDALTFIERNGERWDTAWHDVWSDPDQDEPHLAYIHQRLMIALRGRVRWQGAWGFPRDIRRALQRRPKLRNVAAWQEVG